MKRRALIIYCGNTSSGQLNGPPWDNENIRDLLVSKLGGEWHVNEIRSLNNPRASSVLTAVNTFLNGVDYTFIVFSGHGFINTDDDDRQYIELADTSISIAHLRTNAPRQSLIIDACRGFYSPAQEVLKSFTESRDHFLGGFESTRELFNQAVLTADEGWTIMYSASQNQTSLDTATGGAYLLSLLKSLHLWGENDLQHTMLGLNVAQQFAASMLRNYETIQVPTMNNEKRLRHFPIAVKLSIIHG